MWQMLSDEPELGYRVGGVVGKQAQVAPWQGIPHRSALADLPQLADEVGAEGVILVSSAMTAAESAAAVRDSLACGLHVQFWPGLAGVLSSRIRTAPVSGLPMLYVEAHRPPAWHHSGEASHRHRDRRRPASAVRAGAAGGRDRHPPGRRWPGPLPACRDRQVRGSDRSAQAPHDGAERRPDARRHRGDEREEGRSPLQGVQRPAGDSDRPHPAGHEHRRAPSALGCPDRPDEPGRTAIRHAQGSRPVRRGAAAADRHATRDNRLVANRSPGQPVLQRVPAVGPALRRQLVPRSGPGHTREHGSRRDRPGGEGPAPDEAVIAGKGSLPGRPSLRSSKHREQIVAESKDEGERFHSHPDHRPEPAGAVRPPGLVGVPHPDPSRLPGGGGLPQGSGRPFLPGHRRSPDLQVPAVLPRGRRRFVLRRICLLVRRHPVPVAQGRPGRSLRRSPELQSS